VARPTPAGLAEALGATLHEVAAAGDRGPAAARRAVEAWRMPEARWTALVTDGYRPHWRAYAAAFDADAGAVAARLVELARRGGPVEARWQYADDPRLSRAQVRLRWVLPTGRPGVVADVGGAPLDVVFAWDGAAWRALIGVDDVQLARTRAADPACAEALAAAGRPGTCTDLAWMIADAALRGQPDRLRRACGLAAANGCERPAAAAP
jgi:hypothetical protein